MSTFKYKAVDRGGRPARGTLDAVNEVDLELRLRRMGLDLITYRPIDEKATSFGVGGRITRQDLINFCFDMEQMNRSGIPLIDGLRDLRDTIDHPRFRAAYDFLLLRAAAGEVEQEVAQWWTDIQAKSAEDRTAMVEQGDGGQPSSGGQRRRRRRRRPRPPAA